MIQRRCIVGQRDGHGQRQRGAAFGTVRTRSPAARPQGMSQRPEGGRTLRPVIGQRKGTGPAACLALTGQGTGAGGAERLRITGLAAQQAGARQQPAGQHPQPAAGVVPDRPDAHAWPGGPRKPSGISWRRCAVVSQSGCLVVVQRRSPVVLGPGCPVLYVSRGFVGINPVHDMLLNEKYSITIQSKSMPIERHSHPGRIPIGKARHLEASPA